MYSFFSLSVLLLALAALASGCVKVPLKQSDASVDVSNEALLFMTARISNTYKPSYQPRIIRTYFHPGGCSPIFQRDCPLLYSKTDRPYEIGAAYEEYLLSFRVPPGRYFLQYGLAQGFDRDLGLVRGEFWVPIHRAIDVREPGAYYLGRVNATVVERTSENQNHAGPNHMGIDQRLAGAWGGTFVVKIEDRFDEDMRILTPRYPALSKLTVMKLLLLPGPQRKESELEPPK